MCPMQYLETDVSSTNVHACYNTLEAILLSYT